MLASGTLSLTIAGAGDDANASGDLDVLDHLILRGAGSGSTEIGADFMDRVLDSCSAILVVQDLKLTRGGTTGNGELSLDASGTLSHNHADEDGGGLHTPDGVWLRDSIVDENTSDGTGGGVFGGGHVQAATIPIPVDSKPKVFLPYITKNAK